MDIFLIVSQSEYAGEVLLRMRVSAGYFNILHIVIIESHIYDVSIHSSGIRVADTIHIEIKDHTTTKSTIN